MAAIIEKIFFDKLILSASDIIPHYLPLEGKIIDINTADILYKFSSLEINKNYHFSIEFDSYKYADIYQPTTSEYKNQIHSKIYNIYLFVHIKNCIRNCYTNLVLKLALTKYFIFIQTKELSSKLNYTTTNISEFINYRKNNPMYIIPWYYFRINKHYVFDFRKKIILSSAQITKTYFKRKGGIIETNNVHRIIDTYKEKYNPSKTIVILPESMLSLWSGYNKITYDALDTIDYTELYSINKLIVHECHINFLAAIKKFINKLRISEIWIINCLPLKMYFNDTLNINKIASITNIWLNFDIYSKKKFKTEIIRTIFSKFNQYYTISSDPSLTISPDIQILLSPFENYLKSKINESYINWKTKLTNNDNNIYSFTTRDKSYKLETKIFRSLIVLINNVMPYDNKKYLCDTDFNCPICYAGSDIVGTMSVCGHYVCLECMIRTLSVRNKCSICNKFITVRNVDIIRESIVDYESNFIKFLDSIDNAHNVVVSDLCIRQKGFRLIDITKRGIWHKLNLIDKDSNIYILSTPNKILSSTIRNIFDMVIGYLKLCNYKIIIVEIQ